MTRALRAASVKVKQRIAQEVVDMAKKVTVASVTKGREKSKKQIAKETKKAAKVQKRIDKLDSRIEKLQAKKVKLEKKRDLGK